MESFIYTRPDSNQDFEMERDDHGNLIYFKVGSFEERREYENDKLVRYWNSMGDEAHWIYNEHGKLISYKNNHNYSIE